MKTYLKLNHLLPFLVIFCVSCNAQNISTPKYIDQEKPGITPKIFAPGLVSKSDQNEFGSIFSKDGHQFYFAVDLDGRAEIRTIKLVNGEWRGPETIISDENYGFNDPFLSPDEQELYYISDLPRSPNDTIDDIDIWYSTKTKSGWSEPINAGPEINSDKNEYYISFTSSGKMYFSTNKMANEGRDHDFDIYSSARVKNEYQPAEKLNDSINTGRYEADVFIAPDESYIIFCAALKEGFGRGDLYISFNKGLNEWTKPKNLGPDVNSVNHELCPFVTNDGKYFFYTSNSDIYWVSTEYLKKFKQ